MNTSTPTVGSQPDGGSIKESIAALRSILMIDTPTKSLLSPSVAAQNSRAQQWDELSKLRSKASELKHQIQEATNEAAQENRKRKTLQTTYDALAKHRKELSVQLELVSKSREAVEEKLASMRKNLNEERVAISKERAQWRPEINQLRREKKKWEESSNTFEARCVTAEQHAQQSERRVATLEKELVETQVMLQAQQSFQVTLQPRIEQAEKARHVAEENVSLAQNELERIKSRHQKSLASMLNIQQNLKKKLKEVREEYKVTERKLEELKKDLDDAQTTQTLAIEKQREAMVALEAKNSDYDCLKEKVGRMKITFPNLVVDPIA